MSVDDREALDTIDGIDGIGNNNGNRNRNPNLLPGNERRWQADEPYPDMNQYLDRQFQQHLSRAMMVDNDHIYNSNSEGDVSMSTTSHHRPRQRRSFRPEAMYDEPHPSVLLPQRHSPRSPPSIGNDSADDLMFGSHELPSLTEISYPWSDAARLVAMSSNADGTLRRRPTSRYTDDDPYSGVLLEGRRPPSTPTSASVNNHPLATVSFEDPDRRDSFATGHASTATPSEHPRRHSLGRDFGLSSSWSSPLGDDDDDDYATGVFDPHVERSPFGREPHWRRLRRSNDRHTNSSSNRNIRSNDDITRGPMERVVHGLLRLQLLDLPEEVQGKLQ
eukprot:CAMPEP_0119550988 /NCGR_PEP_ID=MMETSP1352-20130426/4395_1 /TAXON_ID=265584 /ORGANISM="Stauroneis constricta, Strain CCMP1120" /LENGTH=332 /DNA_ID=CAMNT_0007596989 /DNA_START=615 /DNA_END=1614 /DNA_ORIENTATION=-